MSPGRETSRTQSCLRSLRPGSERLPGQAGTHHLSGVVRVADNEVAPARKTHAQLDIVGQEMPALDELPSRGPHRRFVSGDALVALFERGPGVAEALPFLGG